MEPKDLLLADLDHFTQSLVANEEVGEKRLTFFVTLLTAVAAGLVALSAREPGLEAPLVREVAVGAVAALLVIGLLSYLRMLQRNRVTDEYQYTLGYIRSRYVALCPELGGYSVPRRPPHRRGRRRAALLRGGYAETFAVINGMLLVSLLVLAEMDSWVAAAVAGFLLAAVLWGIASPRDKPGPGDPWVGGGRGEYFRAGAGAVITHADGRVLVLERSDVPGAWQLPQGGLAGGEDPYHAAVREVEEETGIDPAELRLLGRYPEPLAYELPPEARSSKTGRGQVHWWFVFRFEGQSTEIELPKKGEFRSWAWRPLDEIVREAADFRQPAYRRLQEFVATLKGPATG